GDNIHGYEIQQIKRIEELDLVATILEHKQTGAKHLHINRNDNNNVFAVGFNTPVSNSTGVSHVLEHTTLCGSTRYPVHDPFFKMLNRSLASYMNALTGSDYTIYPFATTNFIDYKNLQSVYMDAVLHPLLNELDFKQEGWRLEFDDINDSSSSLNFKGVVYNEMKGRVSDQNYLHYKQALQALHSGTTYQHASGGDPKYITDLTYNELCEYHKNYYHPSNAKFYTYGNFPLDEHLATIHAKISGYDRITPPSINKITPKWTSPRKVFSTCALDPHGHSSPMYKALVESQLGSAYSVNVGYNQGTRISNFTVGLQGVNSNEVESRIYEVLDQVKKNGFGKERIEAALHQMELGSKHKTARFGLTLMHGITPGWNNGADPIDLLRINKHVNRLRNELQHAPIFESLIDKYLLGNKHVLTFIMQPDVYYTAKLHNEETHRLSAKLAPLTLEEKQYILDQGQLLSKKQSRKEVDDVSCLPTLQLNDISLKQQKIELDHIGLGTPVQWRNTSTNGITYVKAIFTLPQLTDEIKQYVPLFCGALKNLGTKSHSMADLDDQIRLYTGSFGISSNSSTNHSDLDSLEESVMITGNCLDNNIGKMYNLMSQLIQETNFDNINKLKTLIKSKTSYLNNSIINSGHAYASTYSSSTITPASASNEILTGLSQIKFMNKLNTLANLSDVVEKLKYLATLIIHQSSMRVAITCGEEAMNENISHLSTLINRLPKHAASNNPLTDVYSFNPSFKNTFYPIQSSVNFSAKSLRGVQYTHPDSAKLQVLSSLLTSHYLHREIREKNGAYGGGATYSGLNGIFTFYSYRDPKLMSTIDTYNHAVDWIQKQNFTDQDMTEAKLSIFKQIDAPVNVSSEGMIQFIHGVSDYMRQIRREQLLKVTQNDIQHVANIYLNQQYNTTILGNEKFAKELIGKWNINI
ncbi:peptidase M16C associated-domain-containing protein, partial [Cunninghamella echinulata]